MEKSDTLRLPRSALSEDLWRNNGLLLRVYIYLIAVSTDGIAKATSVAKIMKATKLTERQVRDALEILERSDRTSSKRSNKGSDITICALEYSATSTSSKRSDRRSSKRSDRKTSESTVSEAHIQPPFVAPEYADTWRKFIQYRKEIKKPYKSETSERIAYNKMVEMSGNNPEAAKDMVERTILGQWQGLFPKDKNGTKSITTADNAASRKAQRDRGLSLATEIVANSENLLNLYNGGGSDPDTCKN